MFRILMDTTDLLSLPTNPSPTHDAPDRARRQTLLVLSDFNRYPRIPTTRDLTDTVMSPFRARDVRRDQRLWVEIFRRSPPGVWETGTPQIPQEWGNPRPDALRG